MSQNSYTMNKLQVILRIPDEVLDSFSEEAIAEYLMYDVRGCVCAILRNLYKLSKECNLKPTEYLKSRHTGWPDDPFIVEKTDKVVVGLGVDEEGPKPLTLKQKFEIALKELQEKQPHYPRFSVGDFTTDLVALFEEKHWIGGNE